MNKIIIKFKLMILKKYNHLKQREVQRMKIKNLE